jgi:hypothetical protein
LLSVVEAVEVMAIPLQTVGAAAVAGLALSWPVA